MSKDISLLAVTESDLTLLHEWFNDPRAAGEYDGILATSLEKVIKRFVAGHFSGTRIISFENEKIGWTEISVFAESSKSASLTIQISRPELRGKGLGKRIHEIAIADFLNTHTQVEFIEAWTHALNAAENKILRSLNFIKQDDSNKMFDIHGTPQPFLAYELKIARG